MTTQVTTSVDRTIKVMQANDALRQLSDLLPTIFEQHEHEPTGSSVLLVQSAMKGLTDVIAENTLEVQEGIE